MKKLITLLFSLLVLGGLCHADLAGYTIKSYTSEYDLQKDGTLKVRETINVSFNERRHGIYRNIPYKYSNGYSTPIKNVKIIGENFTTSKNGDNFQIKIGDKNKTIIGDHEYIMEYDIKKTVRTFSGWQELYWNLLGLEWNTPVNKYSFKLQLPENVKISDEDFYVVYGPKGSKTKLDAHIEDNSIIIDHPMNIGANQAVTIGIKFPPNTFEGSVLDKVSTFIFGTPEGFYGTKFGKLIKPFISKIINILNTILSIVLVILLIFSFLISNLKIVLEPKHLRIKRKNLRDVIHYTPPKGYSPIEINLLYNRYPSTEIITTALYTRVAEGYMKVNVEKKFFGLKKATSFEVIKQKEDFGKKERKTFRKDLEKGLWNRIVPEGITNIEWNVFKHNIDSIKFIANKMFVYLRHELIPEVYYKRYENTKQTKVSLSFFSLCGFFALMIFLNNPSTESKLIALGFYVLGGIFWIGISYLRYYYKARKELKENDDESHLTDKGKETLEQIHGFRKFLLSVEDNRLNKLLKEDPKYCEKMLPYAIALGVGDKWIKKCRGFSDKFDIETIPSEITSSPWGFTETVMASGAISEIAISKSEGGDWGSDSGFDSGGSSSGSSGGGGGGGGGGSW